MARLPDNIERVRDGRGYRYRGYTKDGFAARLRRDPTSSFWHAYTLGGSYVGRGETLAEISRKLENFESKGN